LVFSLASSPPRRARSRRLPRSIDDAPDADALFFVSALSPAFPSHFYAFALRSFRNRTIRRALGT
jgi:hypothetical protein